MMLFAVVVTAISINGQQPPERTEGAPYVMTTSTNRFRHVFKYDKPDNKPIYFGGESCASNAAAADYCVVIDAT